jgi:hypothetical protein
VQDVEMVDIVHGIQQLHMPCQLNDLLHVVIEVCEYHLVKRDAKILMIESPFIVQHLSNGSPQEVHLFVNNGNS